MPALRPLLLGLLLGACFAAPAQGQRLHTLAIQHGTVYVDGHALPPETLPDSLDLSAVTVRVSFTGDVHPVLPLDGHFYTVRDGTLHRIAPPPATQPARLAEAGAPPVRVAGRSAAARFEAAASPAPALFSLALDRPGIQTVSSIARHADALQAYGEAVQREAFVAFERARALPQHEVHLQLGEMAAEESALRAHLRAERDGDHASLRLAAEIRALSAGPQRDHLLDRLRLQLTDVFQLKQANRRREIEQLEMRLAVLHERLRERERLQEHIVEQRLRELIAPRR